MTPQTQLIDRPPTPQDRRVRVVTLFRLYALCDNASQNGAKFTMDRATRSRVTVTGRAKLAGDRHEAVFPCYPSSDPGNPCVVLDDMHPTEASAKLFALLIGEG